MAEFLGELGGLAMAGALVVAAKVGYDRMEARRQRRARFTAWLNTPAGMRAWAMLGAREAHELPASRTPLRLVREGDRG